MNSIFKTLVTKIGTVQRKTGTVHLTNFIHMFSTLLFIFNQFRHSSGYLEADFQEAMVRPFSVKLFCAFKVFISIFVFEKVIWSLQWSNLVDCLFWTATGKW